MSLTTLYLCQNLFLLTAGGARITQHYNKQTGPSDNPADQFSCYIVWRVKVRAKSFFTFHWGSNCRPVYNINIAKQWSKHKKRVCCILSLTSAFVNLPHCITFHREASWGVEAQPIPGTERNVLCILTLHKVTRRRTTESHHTAFCVVLITPLKKAQIELHRPIALKKKITLTELLPLAGRTLKDFNEVLQKQNLQNVCVCLFYVNPVFMYAALVPHPMWLMWKQSFSVIPFNLFILYFSFVFIWTVIFLSRVCIMKSWCRAE